MTSFTHDGFTMAWGVLSIWFFLRMDKKRAIARSRLPYIALGFYIAGVAIDLVAKLIF